MVMRLAILSLVLTLASSALVHAQAPTLSWRAPTSCPRAAEVQAAVARALPADVALGALAVEAEVTLDDGLYRLDLTMRSPLANTRRRLFAQRCDTFVQLLVLELGMASLPPLPERAQAARRSFRARASVGLGSGPGPGLATRLALGAGLRLGRLKLELGGSYDVPRTTTYREPAGIGARLSLFAAQLRACAVFDLGPLELPLCGGLEAGAFHGEARGLPDGRSATRAWTALTTSVAVRYPRRARVALVVELAALLGLLRPTFGVRNLPPLQRASGLSILGSLGLEAHFD